MNRNISIVEELEFQKVIMDNLSYRDIYDITKDIIERLEGCRELFVDDIHLYTKYCKRIVKLRYILSYYEKQAMYTDLRLRNDKKGV